MREVSSTPLNDNSPQLNLSKVLKRASSTLSLNNKAEHEVVTIVDSDEDSLEVVTSSSSSDKDSCSICLGAFNNRSFLNDCFHAFCYYCILQWSEISQTCPLCKKEFSVLIHDVKSITEYKETHIKKDEAAIIPPVVRNNFRNTVRYRTTNRATTARNNSNSNSNNGSNNGSNNVSNSNSNNGSSSNVAPIEIPENQDSRRKRRRNVSPIPQEENVRIKEARQRVYANNLFAKACSTDQKTRKATPQFYKQYEGAKHRLFPWMRNELELLLYNNTEHVFFILEILWKLLDHHHINSDEFKHEMKPFLFDKTDHFCHELYMFATSPYDWKTYLKKVHYDDASSVSRWDMSPVRYIGETSGSSAGDTISNTRWDDETVTRTRSESSSIEFIEERELDVNITTDSSDSEINRISPKLLKITNTNSTEDDPIVVDELDEPSQNCSVTPVYIDLEDIPPTPTPPRSPVSRGGSCSPEPTSPNLRYNSPASHPRASPIKHLNSPCFPCSPIRNNSPSYSRSPSPVKGKGKERKRKKKHGGSPTVTLTKKPSPIRVLMDDSEPCSSKYLT